MARKTATPKDEETPAEGQVGVQVIDNEDAAEDPAEEVAEETREETPVEDPAEPTDEASEEPTDEEPEEPTGPSVVAPIVERGASIKVYSRRDEDLAGAKSAFGKAVTDARFVGNRLWVVGEGFLFPGEVIIDVRRDNGQDHARFSLWAEAETWEQNLPGLSGVGDWLIHAEQVVTQVGEGRDDHLQRVIETRPVKLSLR